MDGPYLSRSGNHVAYPVFKGDRGFMVMDGKKDGPFTLMWPPVWSEDGGQFGFIAISQGKQRAVIDHTIDDRFEVLGTGPVFSRDGRRVAFVGIDRDRQFAVIDGKRGPFYANVDKITFSPGGRHVAYVACASDKPERVGGQLLNGFVVLDGTRLKTYDSIEYLTFSGDGRHFAFSARLGDRHLVVRDETEMEYLNRHEEGLRASAFGLTFSPDGRHLLWYTYREEHEVAVFVDGRIVDNSSSLCTSACPRFSSDGRRVTFGVIKGREFWWRVVRIEDP